MGRIFAALLHTCIVTVIKPTVSLFIYLYTVSLLNTQTHRDKDVVVLWSSTAVTMLLNRDTLSWCLDGAIALCLNKTDIEPIIIINNNITNVIHLHLSTHTHHRSHHMLCLKNLGIVRKGKGSMLLYLCVITVRVSHHNELWL